MLIDGKPTRFKVIRNFNPTKDRYSEMFHLSDPDGRLTECENGLGYCKEQARQKWSDVQEFEFTKSK